MDMSDFFGVHKHVHTSEVGGVVIQAELGIDLGHGGLEGVDVLPGGGLLLVKVVQLQRITHIKRAGQQPTQTRKLRKRRFSKMPMRLVASASVSVTGTLNTLPPVFHT